MPTKSIYLILILCLAPTIIANEFTSIWPNHDISTLKLLQIVARHGDRTPIVFHTNDPYQSDTYWPEGFGHLTAKGKYRMYKIGQFLRLAYGKYFGDRYSPREVYARSSIKHRCIESMACLLSGAYPPNSELWQWTNETDLGQKWQPFPIETFMPLNKDNLLTNDQFCPNANKVYKRVQGTVKFQKFMAENGGHRHKLLKNLTKLAGIIPKYKNSWFANVYFFVQTLSIEHERGLWWSNTETFNQTWKDKDETIILSEMTEIILYMQKILVLSEHQASARLRAGDLIAELANNIRLYINQNETAIGKKLFAYSTHEDKILSLLMALKLDNYNIVPFGASLLFELHKNDSCQACDNNYFVRIYYYNETLSDRPPYAMRVNACDGLVDCPLDKIEELVRKLTPSDWYGECGYDVKDKGEVECVWTIPVFIKVTLLVNVVSFLATSLLLYCKRLSSARKRAAKLLKLSKEIAN